MAIGYEVESYSTDNALARYVGLPTLPFAGTFRYGTPPPPPPPPPPPRTPPGQLAACLGLPDGGGAARLYLAAASASGVTVSASFDFGLTFSAGQGAYGAPTGAPTPQRVTSFLALRSGRLYLNGTDGAGGAWAAARVCDDVRGLAATWRDAATTNAAHGLGVTPAWATRGSAAGGRGAGGRTGGPWALLANGRTAPGALLSLDGGDTWQADAALASYAGVLAQPVHQRGVSFDGLAVSADDFRAHRAAPTGGGGGLVQSAEGETAWLLAVDEATGAASATPLRDGTFSAGTPVALHVSATGDGAALSPLVLDTTVAAVGWAWLEGLVVAGVASGLLCVWVSRNGGDWMTRTCHSADAGLTWANG